MRIFVDSANMKEIEHWHCQGVVDGVTTNPSILLKDGVGDLEDGARQLCKLLGERPVSIEVTCSEPMEMLRQARVMAGWADNIVIKIPVITEDGQSCLAVVNTLIRENVAVNCTAILSFNQALLAAKAGATYISIFAGRIGDEGGDSSGVVANVRSWLDRWAYGIFPGRDLAPAGFSPSIESSRNEVGIARSRSSRVGCVNNISA